VSYIRDFLFALGDLFADNPGMDTPDFLIIGGGIIGCSLAWELARASRKVVVLDSGPVGGGASSAAAGLLAPGFGAPPADALAELCARNAALYPSWVEELHEDGAGDVEFCRRGLLDVWITDDDEERERACHRGPAPPGRRVELLSGAELRRREPALSPQARGATYYAEYAQVNTARLAHEVARAAERAGVVLREYEGVHRLAQEGDRVTAVETGRRRYSPGLVVLCAGAWSGLLATRLNIRLPVRPVKGQMLLAECRLSPLQTPLCAGEALFVPQKDGRLVLGVTVEEAGFDSRVTLDGLRTILTHSCAWVPAVGQLPLARAWAGLRPATPDGWPFMGPVPPLHNCWVSTGHFRKGVLLAPLCSRLMARSLLAGRLDEELLPFQPARRLE
jgi:glycine oxidase